MPRTAERKLREKLRQEESEAWDEYLEATRHRDSGFGYEELEDWAWSRLRERLRELEAWRLRLTDE